MSFQTHSGFQGEEIFSEIMVNPKVKGYHSQSALHTTTMQYNHRNILPIHSAQLPHAKQWMASFLEAAIFETGKHNKNLTAAHRELLQWHFRLGCIGFIHVRFLARTIILPLKNPKAVANCDKVRCESCQFGKASCRPTNTQTVVKDKSKEIELKKNDFSWSMSFCASLSVKYTCLFV